MRLGILPLGDGPFDALAPLVAALAARDVDIATPPAEGALLTTPALLRDEARRLARADCDGIVLMVGAGFDPSLVAGVALDTNTPLLLAGRGDSPAYYQAAGTLTQIRALFDRADLADPALAETVFAWLYGNRKSEWHRGLAAARRLHGERLAVAGNVGGGVSSAVWLRQFGVLVAFCAPGSPDLADADFAAPDGDAWGALTDRLLTHLMPPPSEGATAPPIARATVDALAPAGGGDPATAARIAPIGEGRVVCHILPGTVSPSTPFAPAAPLPRLHDTLLSGTLSVVPGDLTAALRAACYALGITVMVLR